MKYLAGLFALFIFCGSSHAQLASNDDFNADTKDTTKWANDLVTGHGVLTQTNQHLEYTVNGSPTAVDQSVRPWKSTRGPYNADWDVQVDTLNAVIAADTNQQIVAGITISDPRSADNEIIAVQFSGGTGAPTPETGFIGRLGSPTNGVFVSALGLDTTNGAVRVHFNSSTKVVTLFYDTDPTDGYTWTQYGSYGIDGSGGTDGNMSWGLSDTNQIVVGVYGYSANSAISADQVALDNFEATGLVAPLVPHNLGIMKMKVPKSATLSDSRPSITSKAVVTIQNLGPTTETITSVDVLTNLVTFQATSLAPSTCPAPVPALVTPATFPIVLAPKKKLNLNYTITFDCANSPTKGTPDFSYSAAVHHEAIDGTADTAPANDVCPRAPSGTDKGCGDKLGNALTTDVVQKLPRS